MRNHWNYRIYPGYHILGKAEFIHFGWTAMMLLPCLFIIGYENIKKRVDCFNLVLFRMISKMLGSNTSQSNLWFYLIQFNQSHNYSSYLLSLYFAPIDLIPLFFAIVWSNAIQSVILGHDQSRLVISTGTENKHWETLERIWHGYDLQTCDQWSHLIAYIDLCNECWWVLNGDGVGDGNWSFTTNSLIIIGLISTGLKHLAIVCKLFLNSLHLFTRKLLQNLLTQHFLKLVLLDTESRYPQSLKYSSCLHSLEGFH